MSVVLDTLPVEATVSASFVDTFIFYMLVTLVVISAIRDMVRQPVEVFSNRMRFIWIAILCLGVIIYPVSAVLAALIYIMFVRPRLHFAKQKISDSEIQQAKQRSFEHRPSDLPPFGWYPDPGGSAFLRWWDGLGWTEILREKGPDPITG